MSRRGRGWEGQSQRGAQSRAQAHVDALRHDLDARDRVRVVACGGRDVVVEEVPDRRVPAKVNLLWRTRRRRRRRDALAVLLAVVDLDSVALQLCPRDCRAKVAALRDERRREKLPDGGHAAEPTRHRLRATGCRTRVKRAPGRLRRCSVRRAASPGRAAGVRGRRRTSNVRCLRCSQAAGGACTSTR